MPFVAGSKCCHGLGNKKDIPFTMRKGSCAAGLACEQMKTCTTGIRRIRKLTRWVLACQSRMSTTPVNVLYINRFCGRRFL